MLDAQDERDEDLIALLKAKGRVFHVTSGTRAKVLEVAPLMSLSPSPLRFSTQAVSIASAPLTVNVLSQGDSALSNVTFTVIGTNAGAFSVVNNCAGQVVPPGSSCGLTVTFCKPLIDAFAVSVAVTS